MFDKGNERKFKLFEQRKTSVSIKTPNDANKIITSYSFVSEAHEII